MYKYYPQSSDWPLDRLSVCECDIQFLLFIASEGGVVMLGISVKVVNLWNNRLISPLYTFDMGTCDIAFGPTSGVPL